MVEFDRFGVPVVGISLHHNALVGRPLLELEWSVGNHVARLSPTSALVGEAAELRDHSERHRIPGVVAGENPQEERGGVIEGHLEGLLIEGFETDLRIIIQLPLVVFLRADHKPEEIGVFRGEDWGEHALVGLHKILRRDALAIGPFRVCAEVKRINQAILGDIPTLGHAGHRIECLRIFRKETFKQGHQQIVFGHTGDHLRIEILWFGTVARIINHQLFTVRSNRSVVA